MTYKIVPTPKFAKSFKKLDTFVRKQIMTYLDRITDNPGAKGQGLSCQSHWTMALSYWCLLCYCQYTGQ